MLVWGEDKTKTHYTKAVETDGERKEGVNRHFEKQYLQKIQMCVGLVHKACENYSFELQANYFSILWDTSAWKLYTLLYHIV